MTVSSNVLVCESFLTQVMWDMYFCVCVCHEVCVCLHVHVSTIITSLWEDICSGLFAVATTRVHSRQYRQNITGVQLGSDSANRPQREPQLIIWRGNDEVSLDKAGCLSQAVLIIGNSIKNSDGLKIHWPITMPHLNFRWIVHIPATTLCYSCS